MDGSLASAQQPHQLPPSVAGITHDPAASAPAQRVPDRSTAVQPEESNPNPELSSSEVAQTTADILQVLQKLQAQQSVTPPTPQTTSFTPKPELPPQPVSVVTKEEPQPTATATATQEDPGSEWDALRASLRENPHDTEGWNKLVRMAEDSGDLEKIKDAYESLLKMYPNTVRNLQSVVHHVLLT
jgi:cleavage stimulation factor subunit 3